MLIKNLLNDKSRFAAVLEYWPESFIDNFVNYYLYNAFYPAELNKVLWAYSKHKKESLATFSKLKIQDTYHQFNNAFDVLEKFITSHFYIPEAHYKGYENPPFCYLEPKLHHNFRISEGGTPEDKEKDSREWDKYKSDLDKYAKNFEMAYKNFLKVARMALEQSGKEEVLKLSPEIYGLGINLKSVWHKFFW